MKSPSESPLWREPSGAREAEEDNDCPTQSDEILVSEVADPLRKPRSVNSRDLVNHKAAPLMQAVRRAGLDAQPEQGRFRGISGERADRHRFGRIEAVILNHHDRARLPGETRPTGSCPDLATSHPSSRLIASMNA